MCNSSNVTTKRMFGGGPWRPWRPAGPGRVLGPAGCSGRQGAQAGRVLRPAGCSGRRGASGRHPERLCSLSKGVSRRGSAYLGAVGLPRRGLACVAWFGQRGVPQAEKSPREHHEELGTPRKPTVLVPQRSAPAVTVPARPGAPALIGTGRTVLLPQARLGERRPRWQAGERELVQHPVPGAVGVELALDEGQGGGGPGQRQGGQQLCCAAEVQRPGGPGPVLRGRKSSAMAVACRPWRSVARPRWPPGPGLRPAR